MDLKYLTKMRDNYQIKLNQLKTFGTSNRIPERIKETEQSIQLLNLDIEKLTKK